jgi:hypothetical protein
MGAVTWVITMSESLVPGLGNEVLGLGVWRILKYTGAVVKGSSLEAQVQLKPPPRQDSSRRSGKRRNRNG